MKKLYEDVLGKRTVFGFQFGEKQEQDEFLDNYKKLMGEIPFETVSMVWRDAGDFYDRQYGGYNGIDNIFKNWDEYVNAPWDEFEIEGTIGGVEITFFVKSSGSGQDYPFIATGSNDPENDGFIEFLKNYK